MRLTDDQTSAWQMMLMANGRVTSRLDDDLVKAVDMTLAEFEVLFHLADADGERLRMNELADRARLSPSGLTRRFDSLVRRGWVVRERCDDDRRGVFARLTPDGRAKLDAALPVHDAGVQEYFFTHLVRGDLECMQRVMERVADANAAPTLVRD
jgi:DNA-binding MarR family transcriptional regulator